MAIRHRDGSAGDANYGAIGSGYSGYRRPEPSIEAAIIRALGSARRVLNVGAGAGSYEPVDREVVAVEPSASMRSQRPAHLPGAVDATAENLPFPDASFDASMATFTVHQWTDLAAGLTEMRRVTRGPILVLTCDPAKVQHFWLNDFAPQVLATEARRYPSLDVIGSTLAGSFEVISVPIPLNCRDGFNEAYYGRPEKLLDEGARLACSAWSFVDQPTSSGYVEALRSEIQSGRWDSKFGALRQQPEYDGSLRLVVANP
jgi:hypothetical protein